MSESRAVAVKMTILYAVIAAILIVGVVFGVRFLKHRSSVLSSQPVAVQEQPRHEENSNPSTPQPVSQQPQSTPASTPSAPTKPAPQVAAAPAPTPASVSAGASVQSTPARVPATGLTDTFALTITVVVTIFAAMQYRQARQRFLDASKAL